MNDANNIKHTQPATVEISFPDFSEILAPITQIAGLRVNYTLQTVGQVGAISKITLRLALRHAWVRAE